MYICYMSSILQVCISIACHPLHVICVILCIPIYLLLFLSLLLDMLFFNLHCDSLLVSYHVMLLSPFTVSKYIISSHMPSLRSTHASLISCILHILHILFYVLHTMLPLIVSGNNFSYTCIPFNNSRSCSSIYINIGNFSLKLQCSYIVWGIPQPPLFHTAIENASHSFIISMQQETHQGSSIPPTLHYFITH